MDLDSSENATEAVKTVTVRQSWASHFRELAVVTFGVILGMLISEARQTYSDRNRAEAAYQGIVDEIAFNQQFLASRIPYYESIKGQLDSIITLHGRTALFNPRDLSKWKGVMPPFVQKAAFTAAQSSGVFEHMNYESVKRINLVYSIQDFIGGNWTMILQSTFKTDDISLAEMKLLFGEFSTFAFELSNAYNQSLKSAELDGMVPKNVLKLN